MREQNQINYHVMQILNQFHRQAKNGSDSRKKEDGRHYERINNYRRYAHLRSDRRTNRNHSPPYSIRKFYASEDSTRSSGVSPLRH
jgi:hypothetical protein